MRNTYLSINEEWDKHGRCKDFKHLLDTLCEMYAHYIVFSTSFNIEDQLITHFIVANQYPIDIFTLDTGRMFQETYNVWSATEEKYDIKIKPYFPASVDVETMLEIQGVNGFYKSIENRKHCCFVRKIKPLQRALTGKKIWITGLRAEHSEYRQNMHLFEWDEKFQIIKFNPLINWTKDEVIDYIKYNHVPYNVLFDKGYMSIGCAPCTRAIKEGEPYRAGRWWWENNENGKKECGLHIK